MAKREIGEINAGSMADIAFLLLIFFLVTTTIEVDAGIGRQLPLKLDNIEPPENLEFNKRNVLEIFANSNDDLLVEGNRINIDELEEIVIDFYTANISGNEVDPTMPMYNKVTAQKATTEIAEIQTALEKDQDNIMFQAELSKWETKLQLTQEIGSYMEMNKSALIQLKNQAGTSYGLYIEIQNILKKVVNELRAAKAEELGWKNYFELDENDEDDQDKILKLRVLVPERIIEAKIDR